MWGLLILVAIVLLYMYSNSANYKLASARCEIAKTEAKISELKTRLHAADTALAVAAESPARMTASCQQDRVELDALRNHVAAVREQLAGAIEQIEFYKQLVAEQGAAISKNPCGYGILGYDTSKLPSHPHQLDTKCADQSLIVDQLLGQLADRDARIAALLKRQNMYVGVY